jgi:hypothetical protein
MCINEYQWVLNTTEGVGRLIQKVKSNETKGKGEKRREEGDGGSGGERSDGSGKKSDGRSMNSAFLNDGSHWQQVDLVFLPRLPSVHKNVVSAAPDPIHQGQLRPLHHCQGGTNQSANQGM